VISVEKVLESVLNGGPKSFIVQRYYCQKTVIVEKLFINNIFMEKMLTILIPESNHLAF